MQDFLSALPFLIFLASVGFLIFIGASIFLVRDIRAMRRDHQEGIPSIWYRRPKILRRIGRVLFWCGPLLSMVYGECALLARGFLHQPLPENTAPLIFIPCIIFLLSMAFYSYAAFMEILNRRSY